MPTAGEGGGGDAGCWRYRGTGGEVDSGVDTAGKVDGADVVAPAVMLVVVEPRAEAAVWVPPQPDAVKAKIVSADAAPIHHFGAITIADGNAPGRTRHCRARWHSSTAAVSRL